MSLLEKRCPTCNSLEFKGHSRYTVQSGEPRWIYHCSSCDSYFSETKQTFGEGLRTPLSRIAMVLDAPQRRHGHQCRLSRVQSGQEQRLSVVGTVGRSQGNVAVICAVPSVLGTTLLKGMRCIRECTKTSLRTNRRDGRSC